MARPSRYPTELRERAVRMVTEHVKDYPSEYEAIRSIATKLGIGSADAAQVGPAGAGRRRPAAGHHD
jgi:transposase